MDFIKLSRRRQVLELQKLGMAIENGDEAVKVFVKSDETTYPTMHVDNAIPVLNPRTMTVANLIYHQYKIENRFYDFTSY